MKTFLNFAKFSTHHLLTRQTLERKLENQSLLDDLHAKDYCIANKTSPLMLVYLLSTDLIQRLLPVSSVKHHLDFCCGPGDFIKLLHQFINIKLSTGLDLSESVLRLAKKQNQNNENLRFEQRDILSLNQAHYKDVDLITWLNGSHHLDSVSQVAEALKWAQESLKDQGLFLLCDLVRPKNRYPCQSLH